MLKIAHHSIYKHPLPEGHRFPMEKYSLVPQQLLYEGSCTEENFFEPGMPNLDHVRAVHTEKYVQDLLNLQLDKSAIRKTGFPFSEALVQRELRIVQGTIQNTEFALEHGISMNIAGGTHHAYADHGEGFCLLNDQAIAARYLQSKGLAEKILIVDLDVHQGNGTAKIFENEGRVFTFSMHGAGNYPFKKEKSDLDIALPDGAEDATYLKKLRKALSQLIQSINPDFIFYLSGVDVLKTDKLGRLALSFEGCKQRDQFVFETCKNHNIPVQVSMGGGYSPEMRTIVDAHVNTFRLAQDIWF